MNDFEIFPEMTTEALIIKMGVQIELLEEHIRKLHQLMADLGLDGVECPEDVDDRVVMSFLRHNID